MTAPGSPQAQVPGAAQVGVLTDLCPVERSAVIALRAWCDGPDGQTYVWQCFAAHHGPERGAAALRCFESLSRLVLRNARRPLAHHSVCCRCAGADECWFARLISLAGENAREDALMLALAFVQPHVALEVVHLAQQVALLLPPIDRPDARPAQVTALRPSSPTLH